MIARRIAALAATVVLILAAMLVRDRIIESNDEGPDRAPTAAAELICVTELTSVCRNIDAGGLTVRVEQAGVTLDRLGAIDATATDVIWLTFDPFPQMVDVLRDVTGPSVFDLGVRPLASSPIALVSSSAEAADLATACGEPVSWRCLGDSGTTTGFARSTDSGTGLLGVAQAALGYHVNSELMLADAQFQRWLRTVVTLVPASQLSGGTAVATIQNRPSSMDVAVGAEAELLATQRGGFTVQYAEPMIRADVTLAVSQGASVPDGLAEVLSAALTGAGWDPPAPTPNPISDAGTITAIRTLWKELT